MCSFLFYFFLIKEGIRGGLEVWLFLSVHASLTWLSLTSFPSALFSAPFLFIPQFTLGGFEHLQALKIQKRADLGLPPLAEDSIQVVKSMRAASPPSYTLDLGESQLAPPPSKLRGRRGSRRVWTKADSGVTLAGQNSGF